MAKMKRVEGGVVKERWDSSQRNTPTKTGSVSAASSPARPSQPTTTNSSFTGGMSSLSSQLSNLQKQESDAGDVTPSTMPLSQQSTNSPTLSPSPLSKTPSNSGSLTSFISAKPESPLPSLSSKLSERPSSSASRKRKSPAPAIEISRKRRSVVVPPPATLPRTPSRRTGRGSIAPGATETRSANINMIRLLLTERGLRMSAPDSDHDVIGKNRTSVDLTFATGLGVFTPFQELVSAFILNLTNNYTEGCARIRRLFNEPYNLRTPQDIVSIGSKTLATALKDEHTSQRNLSSKIYDLSSRIAESYANDSSLSFLRSEISTDDEPDTSSRESEPTYSEKDLQKAISALLVPCNDQAAYFFVRRIQYTWPEFYATYDTWVTLPYVRNTDFPAGGVGELTDLIDDEWGSIKNAVKSVSGTNEYGWQTSTEKDRKRECFVKVIDRVFGAGKNGTLMDLVNESRQK